MNYLLTLFFPLLAIVIGGANSKATNDATYLFSKDYTTILKGVCCIIVVMVHIPYDYQNPVQDAIGSFAYVCVTIFFMVSAYGMQLGVDRKSDYLKNFWRKRLVALLIPCFLVNIGIFLLAMILKKKNPTLDVLWHINSYVIILLQYCLWCFIVTYTAKILKVQKYWIIDGALVLGVVASSLFSYFTTKEHAVSAQMGWCYERYGLIWGILMYRMLPQIKHWLQNKKNMKIIFFFFFSLFLGVAYLKYKYIFFYGEYILKIILGIVLIILLLLLTVKRNFGDKLSIYLGKISYEVYLSHGGIMGLITFCTPKISSGIFIVLTYMVTLLFSAFIHVISERLVRICRK